jgi:hypothetical protein
MSDDNEKWAANIAFVGNKKEVKQLLKMFQESEEGGHIQDLNLIEGPFDSLQLMLKKRKENLFLMAADESPIPDKSIENQSIEIEKNLNKENSDNNLDVEK